MFIDKLIATRRRLFTFLGAYKGDNALLTINDYNNLVESMNQRNGKTEMIFAISGHSLRLVSTGGGCLVGASGCVAGTATLDKYKAASGISSAENTAVGVYDINLDTLGLGLVADAEIYFTNLKGFTKTTKTIVGGKITKLTVTVYGTDDKESDAVLVGSFMHLVFYDKILDTINII
jgi:hypothetical protein